MYEELDVKRREIRIASILPGKWSAEVSCKLTTVSLDDGPSFEALSYVWGDISDKVSITVNDVAFPITKNLNLALRRLRHFEKARDIWVDALCINQALKVEKADQIRLMKEIYSGATEVQIYLGESGILETYTIDEQSTWCNPPRFHWSGHNTPTYHDYCTWQTMHDSQLSRLSPTDRLRQAISSACTIIILLSNARCLSDFLIHNANPKVWKETLAVLGHLASSPWWYRAWVVEEAVLSRSATMVYGETMAPLDIVQRGGSLIPTHIDNCCRDFFYESLSGDLQSHLRAFGHHTAAIELIGHEWYSYKDTEAVRLQRLLGMTRSRNAHDARDKVYSLLGLTKDCSERLGIEADYSRSVCEVYISTAFEIIQRTKSLEILSSLEKKDTRSEIPTWCPDWSSNGNGEDPGDSWVHSRSWKFNAGPSDGNVAQLCHDRILAVKGLCVDVVARVALPLIQHEQLPPRLDEFDQMVDSISGPEARYHNDRTMVEVFWRTMMNDALETKPNEYRSLGAGDQEFLELWRRSLKGGYIDVHESIVRPFLAPPIMVYPKAAHSAQLSDTFKTQSRTTARSFWKCNDNRSFFTTQQGYMGFGPPDMRQGDLVVVLLGSRMPFILRQVSTIANVGQQDNANQIIQYSVVGYSYLHGIMQGEAIVENTNIVNIQLV